MQSCNCPPYDCAGRVRAYLDGDRDAGDELTQKFTPLVRAIVQRVLGQRRRGEWEDACQAVFLRLFSRLDRWDRRCPFCKWLAVVAVRRAIDLARITESHEELPPEVADLSPQPLTPETIECLDQALARLPPEWRQVYELAVQGTPRVEIARSLGKSVRTIQYWLTEIRSRIAPCLDE
jgi:RNA polymerase sigma-70 factor (ECF subfamily)